jgi:hypothetical protein
VLDGAAFQSGTGAGLISNAQVLILPDDTSMSANNRKNRPAEGKANTPAENSGPRSLKDIYAAKKRSSGSRKNGGAKSWIITVVVIVIVVATYAAFQNNGSTPKAVATSSGGTNAAPKLPQKPPPPPPKPVTPSAPAPAKGPRVQFASTTYDFGRANGDDLVDCFFFYTNTGIATLEFSAVTPHCGCMKVRDWTKKLEPGQSGRIDVTYDSHYYTGPFGKSLGVMCNDPDNPNPTLQIQGFVVRPIEVIPLSAALTLTSEVPSNSTTLKIINHADVPLTLTPPVCSNPSFGLELRTNTPGKEFALTVATPPSLPAGRIRGTITMNTSITNMPVLSVEAFADVMPLVSAIPAFGIRLGPPPYTNAVPYSMWIRNNSTNALVLTEPKVNAPDVGVQIKEELAGTQFGVTVTFPAGFEIKPGENVELSVKCSHPTFPMLRIPVMQQPRVTAPAATPGR